MISIMTVMVEADNLDTNEIYFFNSDIEKIQMTKHYFLLYLKNKEKPFLGSIHKNKNLFKNIIAEFL